MLLISTIVSKSTGMYALVASDLGAQDILVVTHVVDIDDRLIAACAPIFQIFVILFLRQQRQDAAQLEHAAV